RGSSKEEKLGRKPRKSISCALVTFTKPASSQTVDWNGSIATCCPAEVQPRSRWLAVKTKQEPPKLKPTSNVRFGLRSIMSSRSIIRLLRLEREPISSNTLPDRPTARRERASATKTGQKDSSSTISDFRFTCDGFV